MSLLLFQANKRILTGILFLIFSITASAQGEAIFKQRCASCHALDKVLSGPALRGVTGRGDWAEDKKNLHEWIQNAPAYMGKSAYTQGLLKQYISQMPSMVGQLNAKDVDAVIAYLENPPAPDAGKTSSGGDDTAGQSSSGNGAVIFGVISLILAIVFLILMQVNSSLKKLSDDKETILRPEPVPFWRNKIYIAMAAIVAFVVIGYFVAKGAIGLGRQQGYQPDQPIFFSHKVHAGINQINCLYCHGGAWESKHAGIPTVNICMNCHKVINSYEKGPKLFDGETAIDGTAEIQKLYAAAGFTPGPGAQWDANNPNAKSPQWIKIHNLPDHVYFNHAQHTRVGNVQCQTCHGSIQQMDKVKQEAELSMGWCINCHRESKVNFNYNDSTGNRFYSIYEKFHNDLKQDTIWTDNTHTRYREIRKARMDSVTVKDIGGLECQKCHY